MEIRKPDLPNLPYSRTFRFGLITVTQLSQLSGTLEMDQSAIVRDAIDEYFERHADSNLELNETSATEDAQR